jgi:hypothetical protein
MDADLIAGFGLLSLLAGPLCFLVQIGERLFLSPRTVGSHLFEQAGGRSAPGEAAVSALPVSG